MTPDGPIPSTGLIAAAGVSSCLVAAVACALTVATFLFTSFNPQIQHRWLIVMACGVAPGLIAGFSFIVGLRRHDLGRQRASLRAFGGSLVAIPVMAAGMTLLIGSLAR